MAARGDDGLAEDLLADGVAADRECGDLYGVAVGLENLAILALRRGDLERARPLLRESLETSRTLGDARTLAHAVAVSAAVVLARGNAEAAARLVAACEAYCRRSSVELDPVELALAGETRERVTNKALAPALAAGAALELGEAVDEAIRALA